MEVLLTFLLWLEVPQHLLLHLAGEEISQLGPGDPGDQPGVGLQGGVHDVIVSLSSESHRKVIGKSSAWQMFHDVSAAVDHQAEEHRHQRDSEPEMIPSHPCPFKRLLIHTKTKSRRIRGELRGC